MAGGEAGAFGALLRRYRQAAALSQEALAERAGLSAVAVSALERGARRAPYLGTVELLASALALGEAERAALLAAARPPGGGPAAAPSADALVPLVGRAPELALLDRFLAGERAPLGSPPVLLLAGEPGMGKTRLLQAAAQQASARGWSVLVGGCQRRGGQEPYAPLLEALARHLQTGGAAQRRAALAGCAWLVRLLPELAEDLEPLPALTVAPEQEHRLINAAVARLLANVAGPAGTLLLLDDLQWAGPDALDLLGALTRGAPPTLRLVGAYRDTEVGVAHPLGLLLADLAQARLVRQHAIGPLAGDEAAALLGDLLVDTPGAAGLVDGVLQRAGGTPFYLVSYAQALQQGGAGGVPWDVAQGVRQRVALLPAAGQQVLGAAAVVGRQIPLALLAAAGQPEEEVLAGLEAACRARLLVEAGEDGYAFAHDLVREVVEAEVGAARRAVLHRRVAEALERTAAETPTELLAYHYARSDAPDKAVPYLEQAGDRAMAQRAHGAAESRYHEALVRLEHLGRAHEAIRVREKLGRVYKRTGRYNAALQTLEPAAETYRSAGDWEGLGRITASIGEVHALRGTPDEGIARLQPLVEQLDHSGGSPLRHAPTSTDADDFRSLAALYLWLGVFMFMAGRYDESLATGERAAELARACGDDRTLVQAAWSRANLLQMLGRLAEAERADHEVLALAEAVGDLQCLVAVPRDLAFIHALRGAFATGLHHIDRSLALAEQLENPGQIGLGLALRGWMAFLAGDWRHAHTDLEQAMALNRQVDRSWHSTYPPIFAARLALGEGEWGAADAAAQEALGLTDENGDLQALRWASGVMAELDLLEGRPEAARKRLVPLLDRPGLEECDVTMLLPALAWAQLDLGRLDQAADAVEQALRRARPEKMRPVLAEALRIKALIALRRGRCDDAAGSLEEGLALARAMPYPYAEARLLQVYGEVHARRGESEAARERLEAARTLFARLGARPDGDRVEQALAALSQNGGPERFEMVVSDALWAQIEALLPAPARTGRRRADDRRILEAILYQQRTGCAWAALPAAYGDRATAHRRLRQWQAAGLWERIAALVQTPAAGHGQGEGHGGADRPAHRTNVEQGP